MHSDLLGQEIEWMPWFLQTHTVVSTLVPKEKMSLEQEEAYYQSALLKSPKRPGYDFKAFLYFGWRILLHKFFNKPMPTKNAWNDDQEYLCTEDADFYGLKDFSADLSMTSPWQLRTYFLATGKWIEESK